MYRLSCPYVIIMLTIVLEFKKKLPVCHVVQLEVDGQSDGDLAMNLAHPGTELESATQHVSSFYYKNETN